MRAENKPAKWNQRGSSGIVPAGPHCQSLGDKQIFLSSPDETTTRLLGCAGILGTAIVLSEITDYK